jgi:magnesium transporter
MERMSMLRAYFLEDGTLRHSDLTPDTAALPPQTVWLDMYQPRGEEESFVERELGIDVPTREEMTEIEASSRLYQEDSAVFMTAALLVKAGTELPESTVMTFILARNCLITVRYADPTPVRIFATYLERHPRVCEAPEAVFAGLMEAIIDRVADVLEAVGADLDSLSHEIFARKSGPNGRDFEEVLTRVGHNGDLISKARESLLSLGRVLMFVVQTGRLKARKSLQGQFKTLSRDVLSLSDHASFLNNKINFLLDATLGMINIEQNNIIKLFSVVAVVFLPPTLIASIYGMNFDWMPELGWPFGYPLALALMLVSAITPYAFFKRRGWL